MQFFSKKRYTDLDDVSLMTEEEKAEAVVALEKRRCEINEELERLMASFARLTKNRKIKVKTKIHRPRFEATARSLII